MRNEFTVVVERDKAWYIAYCPEIPGANGQGKTKAAALNLAEAPQAVWCGPLAQAQGSRARQRKGPQGGVALV